MESVIEQCAPSPDPAHAAAAPAMASWLPGATEVSHRIRRRLIRAGVRFHANDNIADFLREGELELLQREVEAQLHGVLQALVIDVENDHNTRETAERVAKMVTSVMRGSFLSDPALRREFMTLLPGRGHRAV